MLIRFNVANFLSFDEETEFNMLASGSLRTHKEHVYPLKKNIGVLKASAIYGANGAGKSNLIKAMDFFKNTINAGKIPANVNNEKFRLKSGNKELPISMEMEFSYEKKLFTYGFKFDNKIVLEEWFYRTGMSKSKMVFERTHSYEKSQPSIKMDSKYVADDKSKMLISLMEENLLKPEELLISKSENLKIKDIDNALEWVAKRLVFIYPDTILSFLGGTNDSLNDFSNEILKTFQVGIDSVEFRTNTLKQYLDKKGITDKKVDEIKTTIDNDGLLVFDKNTNPVLAVKEKDEYVVKKILTNHNDVFFELNEESDGTRRLMDFLPMIYILPNAEATFVIDEIDRSLHPSILHSLIRKVMNSTTKGQLIFTTHESSLLSCKIFRADEIWFAEKDREKHTTQLYTLNEFKPRPDLDIEKGYLSGRFGAIPFLSKLEDLNWQDNEFQAEGI